MTINQKLACCVCNRPQRVPCGRCNTNDCTCNQVEMTDVKTPKPPVTSLAFEVADITIGEETTLGRVSSNWAHYWPKQLQFVNEHGNEEGGNAGNRMVFSHFRYWIQGYRFGDLLRQLAGFLSPCYVGSKIGTEPKEYSYSQVPCPGTGQTFDFGNPGNFLTPIGECPPITGNCRSTFCNWYEDFYLQGWTPSRTWQWQPDSCSNQSLGGTTYVIEMDWPCVETQEAFDKAQQKYDFGQAQLQVATDFCNNNPNDPDCNSGNPTGCRELCHPAAKDLIGAQPPSLSACIEACPSQAVCNYDDAVYPEVQYPDGAVDPFGWYVPQNITCLTPTEDSAGDGCSFNIQPVEDNWRAKQNCYHQCGFGCPSQQCCLVECFDSQCCDQLLYNPNDPTETVYYNNDGCITDETGALMGGWSAETGLRCSRPEDDCIVYENGIPQLRIKGCRSYPPSNSYRTCTGGDPCCRNGEGPVGGDILRWAIPRMEHPDISIHRYGQYPPPQGIYPQHCPDTLDPFIPRDSSIGQAKCSAHNAPVVGYCKGSTSKNPGLGGNPGDDCFHDGSGDLHSIYEDEHNPRGMICGRDFVYQGGACWPCESWNGGGTLHECNAVVPGHNPAMCGDNPDEDEYNRLVCIENCINAGGTNCSFQCGFCGRSGCLNPPDNCRGNSADGCANGGSCFEVCTQPIMCYYADGTIEEEIGLQLLEVYCDTADWETKRTPRLDSDGEPVLSQGSICSSGGRELYDAGRAFQIRLTYDGTGDSAIHPVVSRISTRNTYELAQEDPLDENSCIFGEYEMLVGGTGWTQNGAPSVPYLSTDPGANALSFHGDWAGLPESCYYNTRLNNDCDQRRSRQEYIAQARTSGPGKYGPKVTVL